jgi:hypothetical protein
MAAFAIFGLNWLHLAVYAEAAIIVTLMLVVAVLRDAIIRLDNRRLRAKRERDEAKDVLNLIRRMSEIRVETLTRMRGFQ